MSDDRSDRFWLSADWVVDLVHTHSLGPSDLLDNISVYKTPPCLLSTPTIPPSLIMSRPFNQWPQSNGPYAQQTDFTFYSTNGQQQRQQQQPQPQPQQPAAAFPNTFQFSHPSSSLQGAFGAAPQQTPPQQVQHNTSLGSTSPNRNNAFNVLPHDTLSVNTAHRVGSGYASNEYLTASPGPIQDHFPGPGFPQSHYRDLTSSAPQQKRQRIPDRNPDDEHDGEINPEKEGVKKQCVVHCPSHLFSISLLCP